MSHRSEASLVLCGNIILTTVILIAESLTTLTPVSRLKPIG